MISYSFRPTPGTLRRISSRRLAAHPEPGCKCSGVGYAAAGHRGWVLAETTDLVALGK